MHDEELAIFTAAIVGIAIVVGGIRMTAERYLLGPAITASALDLKLPTLEDMLKNQGEE